jgi:hypothetical protein
MRAKPAKNVNVAIPELIKDELDDKFNIRIATTKDNLRERIVANKAKALFTHELENSGYIQTLRPMVSNKAWEMGSLQGAINVFIAVGLHAYRECLDEAGKDFTRREKYWEDSYCRSCDERGVSVIEKCRKCDGYVVMDEEVKDGMA